MSENLPSLSVDEGPASFIDEYTRFVRPLKVEHARSYWLFATSADPGAHSRVEEIEALLSDLHSDERVFKALHRWREEEQQDSLLSRQLSVLYPDYRQGQGDSKLRKEIIRRSLKIEQTCSMFRAELDGERLDSNELDRRLLRETNNDRRRQIWETTRQIGQRTAHQVIHLAKLRNELARGLGFSNYYSLALDEEEMNEAQLFDILDDLRDQTDELWLAQKSALDTEFAALRNKSPSSLEPWDYPERFLQSIPRRGREGSTDRWFPITAIQTYAKQYYRGIGMPIDRLWEASDMLPRDGKFPHAFCIGIDNPDDVRVLCNLDSTTRWMETTLHEFGHALYDAGVSAELPWLLRSPAHTFVTEAVAMFFGRLTGDKNWLQEVADVPAELAESASARIQEAQLVFIRWALVVSYFERSFYADPDADLDALWWELVTGLQGIKRPEDWQGGDWASKVHIACYPAYYQNYILGELLASQFTAQIQQDLSGSWVGEARVGSYFQGLFEKGRSLTWPQTVRRHCGQDLSTSHWLSQFGSVA